MSKKIISKLTTLVIAFAMTVAMLAMPAVAEETPVAVPDYSEAIGALKAFGILADEAADPAAEVTRGDFVSVITKIFGIELSETYPAAPKFTDVSSDEKIFTAVSVATDLGLISGFGDGTFRPDETITKTQAVKVIITLLGYEPMVSTYGGYPSGYLTVASIVNILKGINLTGAEQCSWGEVAQILYNALEVNLMKNAKYPVAEYHIAEGSTILNSWLHTYKIEGILQANDITSLTQSEGLPEGKVKIAGNTFLEGEVYASGLLGYRVKAFYKEVTGGVNELVYIIENSTYELVQISAKDIDNATSDMISRFDEKTGKIEKFSISSAPVIYNNKWVARDENINDRLNPEEGNVKLLDNNRDGVIDVVFVEEYSVMFVNTANATSYIITDKYSDSRIVLDPEDTELKFEIIKDGEPADFSVITANTVISILESPVSDGKKFIQVIVGSGRFSGEITELSDDTIYIDGQEYEIFDSVRSEIAKLELLDKSLFYLTYDNKIAGYGIVVTSGVNYGYVTDAGCVKKSGIGSENIATVRMFSISDGKLTNYDTIPQKLSINGRTTDLEGRTYTGKSLIEFLGGSGNIQHQLIQFQLNDKNEIKAVQFVTDSTENGQGYDLDNFSLDYKWETTRWDSSNSNYYRFYKETNGGMFDNRYFSGNGTVLKIPVDAEGNLIGEEFITIPALEDDYTYKMIEVYDSDEYLYGSVIIIRTRSSSVDPTSGTHFIVDKVVTTVQEDGLAVKKLYGYYGKNYVGYPVADETQFDVSTMNTLQRGDVVRILRNDIGAIKNLDKVFTLADNPAKDSYKMNSGGFNDLRNTYAKNSYFRLNSEDVSSHIRVRAINGTILYAMFDQASGIMPTSSAAPVIVYDEKTDTLKVGSLADIIPNDPTQSIVTRTTWGVTNQIYVINRINPYYPVWEGYVDADGNGWK